MRLAASPVTFRAKGPAVAAIKRNVPLMVVQRMEMIAEQKYDYEIDVDDLYGTHYSVAEGFSDTGATGKTVEGTTREIVEDPNILHRSENFVLTVFPAADKGGIRRYWSANNRRLKAIKDAKARLNNPHDFPKVRIKWATAWEFQYATQLGKWGNWEFARRDIEFHDTGSNTLRFQQTLSRNPEVEKQRTEYVEKTEKLLKEKAKEGRGPGKPGHQPLKGNIEKPHKQRDKKPHLQKGRLSAEQQGKIAKEETLTAEQYKDLYNL